MNPDILKCVRKLMPYNILIHATALILRDALRDPNDVADLLLLEFDISVVHSVVELLLKSKSVEVDLHLEELVLK